VTIVAPPPHLSQITAESCVQLASQIVTNLHRLSDADEGLTFREQFELSEALTAICNALTGVHQVVKLEIRRAGLGA